MNSLFNDAKDHVLFSNEDTEFRIIWRADPGPLGLPRYLVRPRVGRRDGAAMVVEMLSRRAPAEARLRLEEEARLGLLLMHPAIAPVHGLFDTPGGFFLLKGFVEGCGLDTILNLSAMRQRPPSEALALHVAREVARALRSASLARDEKGQPLGILHRSVSPGCIRVGVEGEVQLTDFGSAYSLLPGRWRTPTGVIRGAIDYAAPERLCTSEQGDGRSDLFSLGVVLLEMLTGQNLYGLESLEWVTHQSRRVLKSRDGVQAETPGWTSAGEMAALAAAFRPEHVEDAMREVSAPVKAIVHKCLRARPSERYATAAELEEDLVVCQRRSRAYGFQEAARELQEIRHDAQSSLMREKAELLELGVFQERVPRRS